MEIHGEGVGFTTSFPADETLRLAVGAVLSVWPAGILEDDTGRVSVGELHLDDAFIYKDEEALEGWNRLGWDPAHCERLVSLRVERIDPVELLILIESQDAPELALIVERIRTATKLPSNPPPVE